MCICSHAPRVIRNMFVIFRFVLFVMLCHIISAATCCRPYCTLLRRNVHIASLFIICFRLHLMVANIRKYKKKKEKSYQKTKKEV